MRGNEKVLGAVMVTVAQPWKFKNILGGTLKMNGILWCLNYTFGKFFFLILMSFP